MIRYLDQPVIINMNANEGHGTNNTVGKNIRIEEYVEKSESIVTQDDQD